MTVSQDTIVNVLNGYVFESIWNEPQLEYAENVQLISIAPRFLVNWIIGKKYIPLPTNDVQCAVYTVSNILLEGSLIIPTNTWVSSDTIADEYFTLFHVYSSTGIMLPKGSVYLYLNGNNNTVYIAIKKTAFVNTVGIAAWNSIYLSVYRYVQGDATLNCQSFYIPNPDTTNTVTGQVNAAIAASLVITTPGTTVYVNGYDIPTTPTVTLAPGDYVDILTDTTVLGKYTVNLTTTNTGYFSTYYNTYKQLLHTPKALNPQNKIITSELLSLVARRNTDNVGLYITKAATNSVTQVTHNDVAINTEVVNALRTSLGTEDISIEVKIRAHQNTLIREVDYIDYLYINDDATILNFLLGQGPADLSFWTAVELEQSAYVGYMTAPANWVTVPTLGSYITGLGYYTILSILCRHLTNIPVINEPLSNLSIEKPLVLSGSSAYPIVYINGTKVKDSQVNYYNDNHNEVLISFGNSVYYTEGQTITVDLIEAGSSIPYIFTPEEGNTNLTVPFSDVKVYELNILGTPTKGYNTTSSVSLSPVLVQALSPVQAFPTGTGTTNVVFNSTTYGTTYIIQNNTFSKCFYFDVSMLVSGLLPLHVELTTYCSDQTTNISFIGYSSLDVYLNGKRLIKDIDYGANPILDSNGNVSIVQILITNMQFISLTGSNYIEVIARTGDVISSELGYMANNIAGVGNSVEFWYSGVSEAFINGQLQTNPADSGNAILPNPTIGNGIPFTILTELPNQITEVLAGYTPTVDDNRITIINAYFNNLTPNNDISTLIIPNSWKLYSPYLTAIYVDVMTNSTIELFSNDPDEDLFLAQFASYDYLKVNDPTLLAVYTNSKIDLRYCDINPCYGTVSVPDVNSYNILQRLEQLMLTPDPDTLGDVVDA